MSVVKYFSLNPCATCGRNLINLADAKRLGLEYEFVSVTGPTVETSEAAKAGVSLPFFTDGKNYAETAGEMVIAQQNDAEAAKAAKKADKNSKKADKDE